MNTELRDKILDVMIANKWEIEDCADALMALIADQQSDGAWGPWEFGDATEHEAKRIEHHSMPDGQIAFRVWTPAEVVTLYGVKDGLFDANQDGDETHTITGTIKKVKL